MRSEKPPGRRRDQWKALKGDWQGKGERKVFWVGKQPSKNVEMAWVEDARNNRGLQVEEAQNVGSGD